MPDHRIPEERIELDVARGLHPDRAAEATDRPSLGPAAHGLAADRRLAMGAPAVPILRSLQRHAGNRAVVERLGIQRVGPAGVEEVTASDSGAPAADTASPTADASGGDRRVISGSIIELDAGTIILNAPLTRADGVLQSDSVVTDTVIASAYTPGAGNAM